MFFVAETTSITKEVAKNLVTRISEEISMDLSGIA